MSKICSVGESSGNGNSNRNSKGNRNSNGNKNSNGVSIQRWLSFLLYRLTITWLSLTVNT